MVQSRFVLEFYKDAHGNEPVREWLRNDLRLEDRRSIGAALRTILQEQGISVCGTSFGRPLGEGLFEFRLHEDGLLSRVFCHAYGERLILLLGAYDKGKDSSERQQNQEIKAARGHLKEWRRGSRLDNISDCSYTQLMKTSFDEFYEEVEEEARREGAAAIGDLRAKELKYTIISSLLTRRQELHLTQSALAARSGVAQTEISRIERGRKSPTIDTYSRLAAALGLRWSLGTGPTMPRG